MTKKERFKLFRAIARAAEHAADHCSASREFSELVSCIRRQEKEHRAFGVHLVGQQAVKGRFTLAQAVDLFVVLTLARGYESDGRISSLVGEREDYVRAAILVARPEFREMLDHELHEAEKRREICFASTASLLSYAAGLADYSALATGEVA